MRWSWEHVGEHIENLRNLLGTDWERDRTHIENNKEKNLKPSTPRTLPKRGKIIGPHGCKLAHLFDHQEEFLHLHVFFTIFGLG